MTLRKLLSHPCGFRANPPLRVTEFHDVGTDLRMDFTLPGESNSINHTPSWQDLHVDEGHLPCKQTHPLFHSIKSTAARAVGATGGIGIMHTTPKVALQT
jgi:hypothetical protein